LLCLPSSSNWTEEVVWGCWRVIDLLRHLDEERLRM
jgi:hypothetical protein